MNNKIRLICLGWTDFNSSYLNWAFKDNFTIEAYNFNEVYDKSNCIFVVTRPESGIENLYKWLDLGFKLIIVNVWEARPYFLSKNLTAYIDNILLIVGSLNPQDLGFKSVIAVPNWFWYNESLWYSCEPLLQYDQYVPDRTNNKLFFMPIKRSRKFRDMVVDRLNEFLGQSVYSYVERWNNGLHLPIIKESPAARMAWDRQFEPTWYNSTYFSVVVETAVNTCENVELEKNGTPTDGLPCQLFVTEKTFKPIAFQHPFVVCGMKGTLKFLKDNGFETYDHIFDESYDNLDFFEDRLDIIYNNVKNFASEKYLDPRTEQKIAHNFNHFYNRTLVLEGLKNDLIEPMLEWINAK